MQIAQGQKGGGGKLRKGRPQEAYKRKRKDSNPKRKKNLYALMGEDVNGSSVAPAEKKRSSEKIRISV